MVKIMVLLLALVGALAMIPMLFPAVWNTAFVLGGLNIRWMYLILLGLLYFGMKLKMSK